MLVLLLANGDVTFSRLRVELAAAEFALHAVIGCRRVFVLRRFEILRAELGCIRVLRRAGGLHSLPERQTLLLPFGHCFARDRGLLLLGSAAGASALPLLLDWERARILLAEALVPLGHSAFYSFGLHINWLSLLRKHFLADADVLFERGGVELSATHGTLLQLLRL